MMRFKDFTKRQLWQTTIFLWLGFLPVLACQPRDIPVLPEQIQNTGNRRGTSSNQKPKSGNPNEKSVEIAWEKDFAFFSSWLLVFEWQKALTFLTVDSNEGQWFPGSGSSSGKLDPCLVIGEDGVWLNGCEFFDRASVERWWLSGRIKVENLGQRRIVTTSEPLSYQIRKGKKSLQYFWNFTMEAYLPQAGGENIWLVAGDLRWISHQGVEQNVQYFLNYKSKNQEKGGNRIGPLYYKVFFGARHEHQEIAYYSFALENKQWERRSLRSLCESKDQGEKQAEWPLGRFDFYYKPSLSLKNHLLLLSMDQVILAPIEKNKETSEAAKNLTSSLKFCEKLFGRSSVLASKFTDLSILFSPALPLAE
ncbi:MAG: hypothetical protein NZ480_05950 [Bdellovibrionaceae bacterium]|nr:hypothetical protein [Pseudobdellovibrionaceae bacterium]MDW8190473.1 hypothetical protein [Pseudobdellovibrionaceae bacterium]